MFKLVKKSLFKRILAFLLIICVVSGVAVSATSGTAYATAPSSYTTVTSDSTTSVSITSSGTAKYYKFVPTQSGKYKFYSTDYTSDPCGALLDASGSTLTSNDDGGTNCNFSITYECTANTTYYIKVYLYSSSSTGTLKLHIETLSTSSTLTTTPVEINSAGGKNYSLFNSGRTTSSGYSAVYNNSNLAPNSYDNSGYDLYGDISDIPRFRLGLSFKVNIDISEQSTLNIKAWDVDESDKACSYGYEYDYIYLIDETSNTSTKLETHLSGQDDTWNTSAISVASNLLKKGHTYHFELQMTCTGNHTCSYYCITVRNVDLIINGSSEPIVTPETGIANADLSASISSSGVVSASLEANAYSTSSYTLEFKAVYVSGNAQYGGKEYSVSVGTASTVFSTTFQLESNAPRGTYSITVFIKDGTGNVVATRTATASYGYSAVSYNANGGSQNLPTDGNTYSSGDSVTVLFNYVPSKSGYVFLGWSTNRNATTPTYTQNGTKTFTIGSSDVTLYAIWKTNTCEHNWEQTSKTDATCTVDGLIESSCSLCGETKETVLTKLGHNYVNGVCTRCGANEPTADIWDGTVDTTWYNSTATEFTIYTAEQLAGLAQLVNNGNTFSGKTVNLGNDIDLAEKEWTPIGVGSANAWEYDSTWSKYFSGTFNGNGKSICNLKQTQTYFGRTGLFGLTSNATIKNLAITNANINASNNGSYQFAVAGVLGGSDDLSTISCCYVSGSLNIYHSYSGNASAVGGFFGYSTATIDNCISEVQISVENSSVAYNAYVGGFIGEGDGGFTASKCYYNGQIDATASSSGDVYVSGIVGCTHNNTSQAKIEDCFVVGTLKGTAGDAFTSAVYKYWSSAISCEDCYYNAVFIANSTTTTSSTYGTSTSLDNFKSQNWIVNNLGWNFDTVWEFVSANDYPVLKVFENGGQTHTHSYVETSRVEAGCITYGEITYTCSCGATKSELIEPKQHDYKIVKTVEPTCTTDGYIDYACQNAGCQSTKKQVLAKLGHYYNGDNVCDRCGHTIEVHNHEYTTTTVAPTCTAMGYTEHTCSCGYSYRDSYIEPIRHSWNDGEITIASTCITDGVMTYTCSTCGATKTAIIGAEHSWNEVVTVQKTCTTDGSVTKTCSVCGEEIIEVIPAGHNWNEGTETIAPTCETEGSKLCTCLDCGATQSFVIPALGHSYVNGVCMRCGEKFIDNISESSHPIYGMYFEVEDILSDYGPSLIDEYGVLLDYNSDAVLEKVAVYLTQDGTMWRRCIAVKGTNIQHATYVPYLSYKSDIKYTGLNHEWINNFRLNENSDGIWCYSDFATIGVNLEDAYGNLLLSLYDIGQAGAETKIFDDLNEMILWLKGECSGHILSDWIIDQPASCVKGSKHRECTLCHEVLETEEISPVADHVLGEWIVDVEPTSTETGSRHKECSVCHQTIETEVMPVLAKLVISDVQAGAGGTVRVTIDITNNPGIIGAVLTIDYDSRLTLIKAESGSAWSALSFTKPASFTNPCNFVWDGNTTADYSDGTIIVLTFKLPDDGEVGTVYDIGASYVIDNMINSDLEHIAVEIENGSITVVKLIGDVNKDGIVDVADVITLRRYLAGGYGVVVDETVADINGDGKITVEDVVLLRRLLVN